MTHPSSAPDDATRLALDRLASLARLHERASAEDRPALAHACQLLIGLEIGTLRALAKPGSLVPRATDAGS